MKKKIKSAVISIAVIAVLLLAILIGVKNGTLVHRPFNKYHIKQMQIQSLQYHPFCISSGKQLVPC